MAINFLSDLDLSKNKIIGLAVASYASAPSNPVLGQMYFDTTDSTVYCYNGTIWQEIGGGVDIIDNLNSSRTDAALSANQGSVLKGLVDGKVSNTDYASTNTGGVVKSGFGALVNHEGKLYADVISYSDYTSASTERFISKGTLENVITGKQLIDSTLLSNTLQSYALVKTFSYDTYSSYFDRDEITSYISYSDFNKIYDFEYQTIYFYTNERILGRSIIDRILVTEVLVQPSADYNDIKVINITLSNGNYVTISADTTTEKVYKGSTGPNQGGLACFIGNTLVNTKERFKIYKRCSNR